MEHLVGVELVDHVLGKAVRAGAQNDALLGNVLFVVAVLILGDDTRDLAISILRQHIRGSLIVEVHTELEALVHDALASVVEALVAEVDTAGEMLELLALKVLGRLAGPVKHRAIRRLVLFRVRVIITGRGQNLLPPVKGGAALVAPRANEIVVDTHAVLTRELTEILDGVVVQALVLGHLRIEGSNAETMDLKRLAILERDDAGARLGSSARGIDAGKTSAHNHDVCLVGVGELRRLLGLDAPRRELIHPGGVVLNLLVGCSGRLCSGSVADLSLVGQGSRGHSACSENAGSSACPLKKRPAVKMRNLCHENSPFLVVCAHSTPSAPYARATPPAPGLTTPLKHPAPIAGKQ